MNLNLSAEVADFLVHCVEEAADSFADALVTFRDYDMADIRRFNRETLNALIALGDANPERLEIAEA